jgi:hypothetical protein
MGRQSRVVIAVDPRLLAAALAHSLRHAGADVVDLGDESIDDPQGPFDVGFVGRGFELPASIDVGVTVYLPDGPDQAGLTTVTRDGAEEPVALTGLETIFELVERFGRSELLHPA